MVFDEKVLIVSCSCKEFPRREWPKNNDQWVLSQKASFLVGLGGLEPPTSPLSGVRSNHLSYKPLCIPIKWSLKTKQEAVLASNKQMFDGLSRKEVIQPQVHLRLPCYDFTPVAASAVGGNQFSIPT